MTDIIIIGAGPAGLSAAIYAARSGHSVLVLEKAAYGGQIINTPAVENYPGIKNISGFDFATELYEQAQSFGAEIRFEEALALWREDGKWLVDIGKEILAARALIVAAGASNRTLGLPHEEEWVGSGISFCATCDGAFFRGKDVAVAGGGNTALEDALFLSNICRRVYLIHRRNQFRGERHLSDRLREKENVELVLNVTIEELLGSERLSGVAVKDKETGERRELEVDALFIAVGQVPATDNFSEQLPLDEGGYVEAAEDGKTGREGLFVAGDCRKKAVRQLATAASDGANAAISAIAWLEESEAAVG